MLRKDVVEAVKAGKFHIYPVKTIDEGIEILTDVEAGERGKDGAYPKGSINDQVDKKLTSLAEGLKKFVETEKEEQKKKEGRKRGKAS
jgi:predicted ATP-dependent protease